MQNRLSHILNSKIIKNSFWLTILQCVNTIVPMLTIPYITRVLGTSEYGNFSTALNWIIYFQVIVEYGFGLTGAKKTAIANDHSQVQRIYNNIISSRILLLIFTFIILNMIQIIFKFTLKIYICMLLLFLMIIGTSIQLTWLFQGKQDMKFITFVNTFSRIVSVIFTFLFVKRASDIYIYCIFYSFTILLSSLVSIFIAHKKYRLKFDFSSIGNIKNELHEGKYLFFSSAMSKIFSGFGVTILGIFSTSSMVGIYSAIYKIPYILTMFFSPISQSFFPFISKEFSDSYTNGIKKIKQVCVPVFCLFVFFSICIILFRKILIFILFGEEYLEYSIIVIPMICQFIFAMINNFLGVQYLVANNQQSLYSKAFFVGCLGIVISNLILCSFFGIYGVSVASFVGEFILTLSLVYEIRRDLKL